MEVVSSAFDDDQVLFLEEDRHPHTVIPVPIITAAPETATPIPITVQSKKISKLCDQIDKQIALFEAEVLKCHYELANSGISSPPSLTSGHRRRVDLEKWRTTLSERFEVVDDVQGHTVFFIRCVMKFLATGRISEKELRGAVINYCKEAGIRVNTRGGLTGSAVDVSIVCGVLQMLGVIEEEKRENLLTAHRKEKARVAAEATARALGADIPEDVLVQVDETDDGNKVPFINKDISELRPAVVESNSSTKPESALSLVPMDVSRHHSPTCGIDEYVLKTYAATVDKYFDDMLKKKATDQSSQALQNSLKTDGGSIQAIAEEGAIMPETCDAVVSEAQADLEILNVSSGDSMVLDDSQADYATMSEKKRSRAEYECISDDSGVVAATVGSASVVAASEEGPPTEDVEAAKDIRNQLDVIGDVSFPNCNDKLGVLLTAQGSSPMVYNSSPLGNYNYNTEDNNIDVLIDKPTSAVEINSSAVNGHSDNFIDSQPISVDVNGFTTALKCERDEDYIPREEKPSVYSDQIQQQDISVQIKAEKMLVDSAEDPGITIRKEPSVSVEKREYKKMKHARKRKNRGKLKLKSKLVTLLRSEDYTVDPDAWKTLRSAQVAKMLEIAEVRLRPRKVQSLSFTVAYFEWLRGCFPVEPMFLFPSKNTFYKPEKMKPSVRGKRKDDDPLQSGSPIIVKISEPRKKNGAVLPVSVPVVQLKKDSETSSEAVPASDNLAEGELISTAVIDEKAGEQDQKKPSKKALKRGVLGNKDGLLLGGATNGSRVWRMSTNYQETFLNPDDVLKKWADACYEEQVALEIEEAALRQLAGLLNIPVPLQAERPGTNYLSRITARPKKMKPIVEPTREPESLPDESAIISENPAEVKVQEITSVPVEKAVADLQIAKNKSILGVNITGDALVERFKRRVSHRDRNNSGSGKKMGSSSSKSGHGTADGVSTLLPGVEFVLSRRRLRPLQLHETKTQLPSEWDRSMWLAVSRYAVKNSGNSKARASKNSAYTTDPKINSQLMCIPDLAIRSKPMNWRDIAVEFTVLTSNIPLSEQQQTPRAEYSSGGEHTPATIDSGGIMGNKSRKRALSPGRISLKDAETPRGGDTSHSPQADKEETNMTESLEPDDENESRYHASGLHIQSLDTAEHDKIPRNVSSASLASTDASSIDAISESLLENSSLSHTSKKAKSSTDNEVEVPDEHRSRQGKKKLTINVPLTETSNGEPLSSGRPSSVSSTASDWNSMSKKYASVQSPSFRLISYSPAISSQSQHKAHRSAVHFTNDIDSEIGSRPLENDRENILAQNTEMSDACSSDSEDTSDEQILLRHDRVLADMRKKFEAAQAIRLELKLQQKLEKKKSRPPGTPVSFVTSNAASAAGVSPSSGKFVRKHEKVNISRQRIQKPPIHNESGTTGLTPGSAVGGPISKFSPISAKRSKAGIKPRRFSDSEDTIPNLSRPSKVPVAQSSAAIIVSPASTVEKLSPNPFKERKSVDLATSDKKPNKNKKDKRDKKRHLMKKNRISSSTLAETDQDYEMEALKKRGRPRKLP